MKTQYLDVDSKPRLRCLLRLKNEDVFAFDTENQYKCKYVLVTLNAKNSIRFKFQSVTLRPQYALFFGELPEGLPASWFLTVRF